VIRDESGVIAIIVALSISTFLLGFAALAVDLGTAYVRKAELKATAEKVAIAGATGLPDIAKALTAAVTTLGTGATGTAPGTGLCADLDLPGVCDAAPGWQNDGDDTNGEISFYADEGQTGDLADLDGDGELTAADNLTGATEAVGIRVLLPPSNVPFGLASSLGFDSANLTQTATARIGTPLGAGILPFALTPADLTAGQFCVQDPTGLPPPTRPVPDPTAPIVLQAPNALVPYGVTGRTMLVRLAPNLALTNVQVFFQNDPDGQSVTRRPDGRYQVTIPEGEPGTTVRLWATARSFFFGTFISGSDSITYTGVAPTGTSPCTLPQANRGFTKLARSSGGNTLEDNIRLGPEAKLYPSGGAFAGLGESTDCLSDSLSDPTSTTCLSSVRAQPFTRALTDGMFTDDNGRNGRLDGECGARQISSHGYDIDAMKLLDTASPLVDTSFGTVNQLKTSILSGIAPAGKQGWIRSQALRCPRLAMMPVVDPSPLTTVTSVLGGQRIIRFVYVWIDDDGSNRGLAWAGGNRLRSFRGYVISPSLLPTIVAGSPAVGPYLPDLTPLDPRDDLPKEVLLIPDLPSP
jgi:hypothetical protein